MKTFAKKSISSLKPLFSAKKKHFEKIFGLDGVSNTELKIDFRKFFVMISLSENLKNSGFSLVFHPNLSYKNSCNFWCTKLENFSEKFQIVHLSVDNLRKIWNKKVNSPLRLSNFNKDEEIFFPFTNGFNDFKFKA